MALNRSHHHTKYDTRGQFASLGIKCVFISHQQKDKESAKKIADYLMEAGIDVYFDAYDNDLKIHHQSNNAKAVTDSIRKGINNSSHMVVLCSPNTLYSTWVPFEIGYGFDKTDLCVLCLKGIQKGGLPEYIKTAKIIRDIYDLNNFVRDMTGLGKDILLKSNLIEEFNSRANPLYDYMDGLINES
ncbi:toll/interleukin-1 receptor domain-containing protein [Pedobacter sp. FW305-3-2-15-E-R2A2]|uniref:toll/interleukin-1 receptor domain-containing protein n=1 Tax=Pedobacter sp. FW305-3-2-15-E-R2A2 TaxID=3140251 RepID=UPI003140C13F